MQAHGMPSPKEEVVNQRSAWTTRFYSLPAQVEGCLDAVLFHAFWSWRSAEVLGQLLGQQQFPACNMCHFT